MINIDFLQSAMINDSDVMPNEKFFDWIKGQRNQVRVNINKIKFEELRNWGFDEHSNLVHDSGRFFSILGIDVKTNWGTINHWKQPVINQPEIGYLGIICKKINGVLHFLMQAKIEPGNINAVQLSPTLQATKSNYTRVHKGKPPKYLSYFQNKGKNSKVLLDQLQSEQGARFFRKRNRNIIIEVFDEIEMYEEFCWLTLGQIQSYLMKDNLVNMDTRTVISGIGFANMNADFIKFYGAISPLISSQHSFESGMMLSAIETENHLHSMPEVISWITELKSLYELEVKRVRLDSLKDWNKDDYSIFHKDNKYFKVIAVEAEIANREVTAWTQPLIESAQEGIIAFIVQKIKGVYHFLVQAKLEAGNLDILELAPTVQCLTGNYRVGQNEYEVPFLDMVLKNTVTKENVRYDSFQSEEGGRFYREQNRSIIIETYDLSLETEDGYIWMTLNQLKTLIKYNNYLNIQTRSLISMIRFI